VRRIIRRREIVADELLYAGETGAAAPGADGTVAVLSLAQWLAAAGAVTQGEAAPVATPAAVLLAAADEVETLGAHLQGVRWIVIEFAKIGEGRGFSQARLLRQRYRYAHELRARGAINRDQLFLLARCGFDAFDLEAEEDLPAALAAFSTFSVAYQDGSDSLLSVHQRTLAPGA
jgi:uncharacterized protein (DUF934 family)